MAYDGLKKSEFTVVGTRPKRPDGIEKVTGKAQYGADMTAPGMLHGLILRSPHAHARIKSIDASAALALPGVKAVVTQADLPDVDAQDLRDVRENVLAGEKALYDGHAVAAVAATSLSVARAALDKIVVDYEVLPHVTECHRPLGIRTRRCGCRAFEGRCRGQAQFSDGSDASGLY